MNPPPLNGKFTAWISIFRPVKRKPISDIFDFADQDTECPTGYSKWLGSRLCSTPSPLRCQVHLAGRFCGPDGVKEPIIESSYRVGLYNSDTGSSDLFHLKLGDIDSVTHSFWIKERVQRIKAPARSDRLSLQDCV